jgi:hypothetical protein
LHVPAVWQLSSASHTIGLAPMQAPPWHVSTWVHESLSLQVTPFVLGTSPQLPVAGSQLATRQSFEGEHVTGSCPLHPKSSKQKSSKQMTVLSHVALSVHAFWSSHDVPTESCG